MKKGKGIRDYLILLCYVVSVFMVIFSLEKTWADDDVENSVCFKTAKMVLSACQLNAMKEYWLSEASCLNVSSDDEKTVCETESSNNLSSSLEDCTEQYEARTLACSTLREDIYAPQIDPALFSENITNQYFPLTPGTIYVYQGVDEEGESFEDRVEVTNQTTTIDGVKCRVVRDIVSQDGEVMEETFDFFAQDAEGNVWYFGEDSRDYENGWISDIEGAWYTGVKGAKPGIIMKAMPVVGDVYREEYLPGTAEDMGYVVQLGQSVEVPKGRYENCIKILDWSPFEPDVVEYKYYAPGVGFIKSVSTSGEVVELVSIESSN